MINEITKEGKNRPIEITYKDKDGEESSYANSIIEYVYYEREGYKDNPQYLMEVNENMSKYQKAIEECFSKWNTKEQAVYKGIIDNKTKKEISSEIDIPTNEVNNITKKVKSDLKKTLLTMGYVPSRA